MSSSCLRHGMRCRVMEDWRECFEGLAARKYLKAHATMEEHDSGLNELWHRRPPNDVRAVEPPPNHYKTTTASRLVLSLKGLGAAGR